MVEGLCLQAGGRDKVLGIHAGLFPAVLVGGAGLSLQQGLGAMGLRCLLHSAQREA